MRRVLLLLLLFSASLPLPAQTDPARKEVGIFYFAWLGQHPGEQTGIYDITRLREGHPSDLYDTKGTPLSPLHKYHFWSEPLYGYYNSADPWVITRHMELLMAAGIDYIIFDTTNGYIYTDVVRTVLETLLGFQGQGLPVPKVSFYTHAVSDRTVHELYEAFYAGGRYDSLWYRPRGKPMIVGVTCDNKGSADMNPPLFPMYIRDAYRSYFDVREAQWPTMPTDPASFPWMSRSYPQEIHDGVVSVSVAQHSTRKILFSDTLFTRGRGYDAPSGRNLHDQVRSGRNFQNQWDTAISRPDSVRNVFVTGWNEWATIKYVFDGEVGFVDTFSEEFSRDIEMMKGGYEDRFYLQLARNVRDFKKKGPALLSPSRIAGELVFSDPEGDAIVRDHVDFARTGRYADSSARNDFVRVAVSRTRSRIRFRIETARDVTPWAVGDSTWMNVLIRTESVGGRPFPYDFVIGRHPGQGGRTSLERISADGIRHLGQVRYRVSGNEMRVSVPLSLLGLSRKDVRFCFKLADHVTHPFDRMDYYISGDSAPIGGLDYEVDGL